MLYLYVLHKPCFMYIIERSWSKFKSKQWNTEITKIKFDCWSIYRLSTNFLYALETWFNEQ
jgi:hypothetical protein